MFTTVDNLDLFSLSFASPEFPKYKLHVSGFIVPQLFSNWCDSNLIHVYKQTEFLNLGHKLKGITEELYFIQCISLEAYTYLDI